MREKLPMMQRVKSTNCKVNPDLLWENWTRETVYAHALLSLNWSVIHYQVTLNDILGVVRKRLLKDTLKLRQPIKEHLMITF